MSGETMNVVDIVFFLVGGLGAAGACWFGLNSLTEKKPRAAVISVAGGVLLLLVWFGGYAVFRPTATVLVLPVLVVALFALLFFLPLGRRKTLTITRSAARFDEREMMFAREEYEPGTEKFETYYARRPEHKDIDDAIRRLPELLEPGGRFYEPVRARYIKSVFRVNREMTGMVDGELDRDRVEVEPAAITRTIKELTLHLGADDVGVAPLNQRWVYSHIGRGPEPWGAEIRLEHKYVIAFAIEMDYGHVETAPRLPITEETAIGYLNAAKISVALAAYIRRLGYPARAHIAGSNYQVIMPAVAHDVGLGELGRFGYLISPKYGARLRLGAVTTDLPLITDQPIAFGVQDFCAICKKCAANCPSRSIPAEGTSDVRGVGKWPLDAATCLRYWRVVGTDCGICMKVCPFSHPPTFLHNLVRAGIRRSSFARRLSVWGDDLFYGRKVKI